MTLYRLNTESTPGPQLEIFSVIDVCNFLLVQVAPIHREQSPFPFSNLNILKIISVNELPNLRTGPTVFYFPL